MSYVCHLGQHLSGITFGEAKKALGADTGNLTQGTIRMFGKEIPEPRLTKYYGDEAYKYSGRQLEATPGWRDEPFLKRVLSVVHSQIQKRAKLDDMTTLSGS